MPTKITEAEALRRFPELQELITVRQAGWVFRPVGNRDGELVGIVGSYSRQRYTDALWIYSRHEVIGVRVLDEAFGSGTVWLKDNGNLQEVVQELLALPEPGERLAPSLVKSSSLLWVP